MADEIARKTAEDFRLLGGQAPKPAPADPFNAGAPVPGADASIGAAPAVPQGGAAAVEAALERALTKVMAGKPGGGAPAAEIIARLEDRFPKMLAYWDKHHRRFNKIKTFYQLTKS